MSTRSNNLVNPNAREAMNRFKMEAAGEVGVNLKQGCLLYTSPSPRDGATSRMPSSA